VHYDLLLLIQGGRERESTDARRNCGKIYMMLAKEGRLEIEKAYNMQNENFYPIEISY
jgi:hypothetical protein